MEKVLTREESIELASFLADKYREIETKEAEYLNTKAKMDNLPEPSKVPKHSAFRFFWPYLIIASIAEAIVYTIGFIYSFTVNTDLASSIITYTLVIITWPAIVIFGAIRARIRRREYNNGVELKIHSDQRMRVECEKKLESLEKELISIEDETREYDDIVPETMRSFDCMQTVKRTLENGLAENFKDAVSGLKPVGHRSFY